MRVLALSLLFAACIPRSDRFVKELGPGTACSYIEHDRYTCITPQNVKYLCVYDRQHDIAACAPDRSCQ